MAPVFTPTQIADLEAVLSGPRFGTYLREMAGDRDKAMQLYAWNTEISAAFYVTLQFAEVAVRNGAVEAIEIEFGPNWHLNRGFSHTLRVMRRGYQPRDDLSACARRLPTAGKVVAELKFAFWQHLFVTGQDARLWLPHFQTVFPGSDPAKPIPRRRTDMFDTIEKIREFRNRIAHHEPIFGRNLVEEKDRIRSVVAWRRPGSAAWLDSIETVTGLLARRPV